METEVVEPFEWDGIPTHSFLVGFSSTLDLVKMDRQFVFYTTRFSGKDLTQLFWWKFPNICAKRSQHWQLTECSDWRQLNNENEAESVLELANEEVSANQLCFDQGPHKISLGKRQVIIHQVIGAMKSNLPADLVQGAPFVPKDRIFHVKVCKLHWRGDSNVTPGIINITILLISIFLFILRRAHSVSPCTTSNP